MASRAPAVAALVASHSKGRLREMAVVRQRSGGANMDDRFFRTQEEVVALMGMNCSRQNLQQMEETAIRKLWRKPLIIRRAGLMDELIQAVERLE